MFLIVACATLLAQGPATTPAQDSVQAAPAAIMSGQEVGNIQDSGAATAQSAAVGTLTVTTVPDSAVVILDDVVKGSAPITLTDIPAGKHIIIIKKKDYFAKKATITITGGMDNTVTFELVKPVQLLVSSEPSGAAVLLNNERAGKTPYADSKLKPGTYAIRLALEGYEPQQRTVTMNGGGRDSVHAILAPLTKAAPDTAAAPETRGKKEKSKMSSILDKVAIGVFVCFSLVILLIELTQNK